MRSASKILWIDTETSGLDACRHAILSIALLVEIDGVVVEESEFYMNAGDAEIDEAALIANSLDVATVSSYPHPRDSLFRMQRVLDKYVDRFNKYDKFVPAGYNVSFDLNFLYEAYKRLRNGADGYEPGCYLFTAPIDVRTCVGLAVANCGLRLRNYQLGSVCERLRIPLEAHRALNDIRATRQAYEALQATLSSNGGQRRAVA